MASTDIQIVSTESGQPTAVIVPIEFWREIESEPLWTKPLRSLEFDDRGFEDLA